MITKKEMHGFPISLHVFFLGLSNFHRPRALLPWPFLPLKLHQKRFSTIKKSDNNVHINNSPILVCIISAKKFRETFLGLWFQKKKYHEWFKINVSAVSARTGVHVCMDVYTVSPFFCLNKILVCDRSYNKRSNELVASLVNTVFIYFLGKKDGF